MIRPIDLVYNNVFVCTFGWLCNDNNMNNAPLESCRVLMNKIDKRMTYGHGWMDGWMVITLKLVKIHSQSDRVVNINIWWNNWHLTNQTIYICGYILCKIFLNLTIFQTPLSETYLDLIGIKGCFFF